MEHSGLYDYRIMEHSDSASPDEGTPLFLVSGNIREDHNWRWRSTLHAIWLTPSV